MELQQARERILDTGRVVKLKYIILYTGTLHIS